MREADAAQGARRAGYETNPPRADWNGRQAAPKGGGQHARGTRQVDRRVSGDRATRRYIATANKSAPAKLHASVASRTAAALHYETEIITERKHHLLFDCMLAFDVRSGVTVPLSAAEFYAGLAQRFPERDGMYFLPERVAEYHPTRMKTLYVKAVRAGFKKAWQERDYATIIAVARKIPENVLQENPKLLMWYDQALTRFGEDA